MNQQETATTGIQIVFALQGRRTRTWCRSRTTKKGTLLPIKKRKQSPTRAAVAVFIPAFRRASTQAANLISSGPRHS